MDKRKASLANLKICRFCLSEDGTLSSLYDRSHTPKNAVTLSLQIMSCISVEVFPSDGMPSYICDYCRFFMGISYQFKQLCRQSDETILQYVQNGDRLEPNEWPAKLLKIFHSASQMKKKEVKTLVTDGGACVEVTSQEHSETDFDDEDDENVYNIKIATDGSEEVMKKGSACIKMIPAVNKMHTGKGVGPSKKQGDGCWACPKCDCTYPLQQLLELHISQKHRAREAACDQCDEKFFRKQDLMIHQLRHTDEMPFECVACDRKFKRLLLLKRHERNMHSDLPQYPCTRCPATHLSVEELEAHQKRHTQYAVRPYDCDMCNKKFHTNRALTRHKEVVHGSRLLFACEYCPERFSTGPKLAKHVRSHAGERAYPCKFCKKTFTKSHHYTRHLRMKHKQGDGPSRAQFGMCEQYRCDQCDDVFGTQDELIYHSAIHATQNLTCPLCQEKFDDVDAVTSHIKSHVEGVEFLCDFCELVFTCKDKLHTHLEKAHEEELRNEQDDSMDGDDDEDGENISVKDAGDHMLVELKKTDDFMISNIDESPEAQDKTNESNSEGTENEMDVTYTDLSNVETIDLTKSKISEVKQLPRTIKKSTIKQISDMAELKNEIKEDDKVDKKAENQTATILRKAEEIKRKTVHTTETLNNEKGSESSSATRGNDKSLKLLEKELQELKRTSSRGDVKTPAKPMEALRGRRFQLHTSTPRPRIIEEKKLITNKTLNLEKKPIEKRTTITKENKEPKDTKDNKNNNNNTKDEKEENVDMVKNVMKNGSSDKNAPDDSIRRSTRPSKVKDYAKMIRNRSDSEQDSDDDDEEYVESDKSLEARRQRKSITKTPVRPPVPASTSSPLVRKRGRPRKDAREVPTKIKKPEIDDNKMPDVKIKSEKVENRRKSEDVNESEDQTTKKAPDVSSSKAVISNTIMLSPTGQTLKKVSMKSLPPGVKALPLPPGSRPELCEMQIGKKVVKVQKIVMTKAEVEAMTKKGLLEMKDGTMVLKQGIKLPATGDPIAIKSTLMGEENTNKESPTKKEKATPTRCVLDDDA